MRAYKIYRISVVISALLFIMAICLVNYFNLKLLGFRHESQLAMVQEVSRGNSENSILIYGSSAVAVGISAKNISAQLIKPTFNIATLALAKYFDDALNIIFNNIKKNDTVIISDRNYRDFNYEKTNKNLLSEIRLFPFLTQFHMGDDNWKRSKIGDFESYPPITADITYINKLEPDLFNHSSLKLMHSHIDLIKQAKSCPVLAFVPLLVPPSDVPQYLAQHERLIEKIKMAGMLDNVLISPEVYSDKSIFYDGGHMNAKGREIWTQHIIDELKSRNLCQVLS